jgi:hypothetical protein
MVRLESWIRPVGVSAVRVIAGEPGSRLQSRGEILAAERGVESLLGGASARAATAASSDPLLGSRAAHVTAKALSASPGSGSGLGGSLRGRGSCTRARSDHGTRETCLCSLVSKDRLYRPVVKSSGGQRESEGAVGVRIGVQKKAPGAKGPHCGRGRDRGTREGMDGLTVPNLPGGRLPVAVSLSELASSATRALTRNNSGASYGQPPSGRRVRVLMPFDARRDDSPRAASEIRVAGGRVAASGRASVSRVRENRMHGSKGGSGNGPA